MSDPRRRKYIRTNYRSGILHLAGRIEDGLDEPDPDGPEPSCRERRMRRWKGYFKALTVKLKELITEQPAELAMSRPLSG